MPDFDSKNASSSVDIEECKLYVPSDLSEADRCKYCPAELTKMEDRLRFAEASDALESLRHYLRTRSVTNRFKVANITGQAQNTRARETQSRIDDKVRAAMLQYQRSRDALSKLRDHGSWEDTLQVLAASDVRALNEREMTAQEKEGIRRVRGRAGVTGVDDASTERVVATAAAIGEGLRRPSWIWFSGNLQEGADDPITRAGVFLLLLYEDYSLVGTIALGVEWAKTKARADRWEEEVILLDEEMRRVLEFCSWKASWWKERVFLRKNATEPLAEGLCAYSAEQADMEQRIRAAWTTKWANARQLAQPLLQGIVAGKPMQEAVVGPIDREDCEGNADDSDIE